MNECQDDCLFFHVAVTYIQVLLSTPFGKFGGSCHGHPSPQPRLSAAPRPGPLPHTCCEIFEVKSNCLFIFELSRQQELKTEQKLHTGL